MHDEPYACRQRHETHLRQQSDQDRDAKERKNDADPAREGDGDDQCQQTSYAHAWIQCLQQAVLTRYLLGDQRMTEGLGETDQRSCR